MSNLSAGFIFLHSWYALRKVIHFLHKGSYGCSECQRLTLVVLLPPQALLLLVFIACPQRLSHTSNSRCHRGISAAFLLLYSLVFFLHVNPSLYLFFIFFKSSLLTSSHPLLVQSLYSHASNTRPHTSQQDISGCLHLCPALPAAFLSSLLLSHQHNSLSTATPPKRKIERVGDVCPFFPHERCVISAEQ